MLESQCFGICIRRSVMQDVIFVAISVAFFVASIAYVHFCERVK